MNLFYEVVVYPYYMNGIVLKTAVLKLLQNLIQNLARK